MASAGLAALSFIGSGVQAYAEIKAAEAKADNLKDQADLELTVAGEIVEREEFNQILDQTDKRKAVGEALTSFTERGIDANTGVSLTLMNSILRGMNTEIAIRKREAQFDVEVKTRKAVALEKSARDVETSGRIKAVGSLLGGGARAVDILR